MATDKTKSDRWDFKDQRMDQEFSNEGVKTKMSVEKKEFKFKTYEQFIYKRTYARWLDDLGRRENFDETVKRYKDFFIKQVPKKHCKEYNAAIDHILSVDIAPSMRAFFTAGVALERDNIAGYNCCAIAVDTVKSFSELLYILLNGTGVGFTVERQVITKLPIIAETFTEIDKTIVFRDSKLGWAEGYNSFIRHLFNGEIPKYDLSKVRAKGERLKTFGGKASGPEPLDFLLKQTKKMLINAASRKLSSIECHDLCCHIANTVVVGGVRRSACISLSNLSDDRMRDAKAGEFWLANPQRALANNSVAYTEKPSMMTFIKEWQSLVASQTGERGIFNREGCDFIVNKTGRREPGYDWLCNPCCFTGDMRILTSEGYQRFDKIAGPSKAETKKVTLINMDGFHISDSGVWLVGTKPVVSVNFGRNDNMNSIKCTSDHRFLLNDGDECEAKDLIGKRPLQFIDESKTVMGYQEDRKSGMAVESFTAGFLLGDGQLTDRLNDEKLGTSMNLSKDDKDVADFVGVRYIDGKNDYYEGRFTDIANRFGLPEVKKPDEYIPTKVCMGFNGTGSRNAFLCGLYSANGSVLNNGRTFRVTYKTASSLLAEGLIDTLGRMGIDAYRTTNRSKNVEFSNGEFICKESYDVNIAKWEHIKKFAETIGFCQKYKREKLIDGLLRKAPMVTSVKDSGTENVYDFNEKATNFGVVEGCVVHNSEIILRPDSFCNLTEVIVRPWDEEEDLLRKIKYATILGCLQATLTDFKFLNKKFKKNCEDERLLGVSLTGVRDHSTLNHVNEEAKVLLTKMRLMAIETAEEWSKILNIKMPAAITAIKPSGTVSQMVDSASGLHARFSDFYIRRVRVTAEDSLCKFLIEKGVPHSPEVGESKTNPNTYVFDFPIKSPDGAIVNDNVSALEQLEYWKMLQEFYCEHKPSCTVFVKDTEWLEVGAWVFKHWNYVSGVSFLPKDDSLYQLAPYEEIDEDEFDRLKRNFPEISFNDLDKYEKTDNTIGAQEFACSGGSCELR